MLKKYPILLLLLAVVAGYLGYNWFADRPSEVWKYIPSSAAVVISSDKLQESFVGDESDSLPILYKDLPLVSLASGTLSIINWFNPDQEQVAAFLKDKTITYAFHPLAGGRLGIVMYLPVKNDLEAKWLDNPKAGPLRVSSHNFQGHSVTDISNQKSEALFSYILKDDYLIVSQQGELIEDVIRNSKSGTARKDRIDRTFHLLPEGRHKLSIYTKGDQWRNFVFPTDINPTITSLLDLLPDQLGLHVVTESRSTELIVSSENNKTGTHVYSKLLADQEGTPFENASYISQKTTHLLRLGIKNENKFRSTYRKWLKARQGNPALTAFEKAAGGAKQTFYDQIGSEIILCLNENVGGVSDSKTLLIKYEDFEKARPVLQEVTKHAAAGSNENTVFQGYEVYPVRIPELMEGLFGPLFRGFRESYVTYINPYLIVGNDAQSVRSYLIDYENQLTWSHSPGLDTLPVYKQNRAPLNLVTNIKKARSGYARTSLKSSLDRLSSTVLSYEQHGKYAGFSLALNYAAPVKRPNQTELIADIEWKDLFPSAFPAMINSAEGTSEVLLTDRQHQLIRVTSRATAPQVITQLDGPIVGRTFKTDFLNIGRPQWIISTSNTLYVIDEDEKGLITVLVDPAPTPIQSIYRINESRESSAKFVLKGSDHNLYLWGRVHKSPLKLKATERFDQILSPVVSLPHGNTSNYIITQSNGKVFAVNEQQGVLKGFPVDMLSRIVGPFATVQNSATGETEIRGVNRQGEFVRITIEGELKAREQLLLPEAGCSFRTLYDENTMDWLLLRQTPSKAAILTKDGNELFEIVNLRRDFVIRYHYFGSDNRFISVVSGGFISVFDLNGSRIGDNPIPCDGALALTYHSQGKEITLFSQAEGKIQIWSVKL